uniref:Uncharacterized protein n=1 Tax=Anguilla anguilla TaxID=7936 RepID=A0A0E9U9Q0_ANGAN
MFFNSRKLTFPVRLSDYSLFQLLKHGITCV